MFAGLAGSPRLAIIRAAVIHGRLAGSAAFLRGRPSRLSGWRCESGHRSGPRPRVRAAAAGCGRAGDYYYYYYYYSYYNNNYYCYYYYYYSYYYYHVYHNSYYALVLVLVLL